MPFILASIEDFLREQNFRFAGRRSPEYFTWGFNYIGDPSQPLLITRRRTAKEAGKIVTYCVEREIDFAVRVGGHDLQGRSTIQDGVTIDLREIAHVLVIEDRHTARVDGGILLSSLLDKLGREQLSTPVGAVGTVGYIGWTTLGGFGAFTPSLGLGSDNTVGARLVDDHGRLVDADASLSKAIRGGGPAVGVIVELTIKVYPLDEVRLSISIENSSLPLI